MVERRVCSFCGNEIEPGTGKMFIKTDGTVFNFCTNKCHKNLIVLKRLPRRTRWTQAYMREKSAKISAKEKEKAKRKKGKPGKKVAKKLKKVARKKTEGEKGKVKESKKAEVEK